MESKSRSNELGLLLAHAKEYHDRNYAFYEHGFISYSVSGESRLTIYDIFVVDYKRRKGLAFEYANDFQAIVKDLGVTKIFGMVQKKYKNKEASIAALEYWGMEEYTEDEDTKYYLKEI